MAKRVIQELVDDVDGTPANETVQVALDGVTYELDLSTEHAEQLREAVQGWTKHGRKIAGRRSSRKGGGPNNEDVRRWARENGFEVKERGRVSATVRNAYLAAQTAA